MAVTRPATPRKAGHPGRRHPPAGPRLTSRWRSRACKKDTRCLFSAESHNYLWLRVLWLLDEKRQRVSFSGPWPLSSGKWDAGDTGDAGRGWGGAFQAYNMWGAVVPARVSRQRYNAAVRALNMSVEGGTPGWPGNDGSCLLTSRWRSRAGGWRRWARAGGDCRSRRPRGCGPRATRPARWARGRAWGGAG